MEVAAGVFDRLTVVTLGAILIAAGAFAINNPTTVRTYVVGALPLAKLSVSDDQVRMAGVALVLIAALVVVGALLSPLRAVPPQ